MMVDWDIIKYAYQLLIFDLSTDKLVKHITIPLEIAHNKKLFGLLSSVLVYAPDCRDITNNAIVSIFLNSRKIV